MQFNELTVVGLHSSLVLLMSPLLTVSNPLRSNGHLIFVYNNKDVINLCLQRA